MGRDKFIKISSVGKETCYEVQPVLPKCQEKYLCLKYRPVIM